MQVDGEVHGVLARCDCLVALYESTRWPHPDTGLLVAFDLAAGGRLLCSTENSTCA